MAERTRARVLAVDDDPSFLALLRRLVRATTHLEIAGEAHSGESAVEATRDLRPEIVLMDIRMPGIGGLEAAKRIKAEHPATLIVMISSLHPDEIPAHACNGFAGAVLWKSTLGPKVLDEIWHRASQRERAPGDECGAGDEGDPQQHLP